MSSGTPEEVAFANSVETFIQRGQLLLDGAAVEVAGEFNLDKLDALFNNGAFTALLSATTPIPAVVALNDELTQLKDYLTLVHASNELKTGGYIINPDSPLKIYRQTNIDTRNRTSVRKYSQDIWESAKLDDANNWNKLEGPYLKRLDYRSDNIELTNLADNDLDNARGTQSLLEIYYDVDGQTGTIGGPPLAGNNIELEKAYIAAIDNLDTSYYTYSYYGVSSSGDRLLEAVAVRRLNETNPILNSTVDSNDQLELNHYLTASNWQKWIDDLNSDGKLPKYQLWGLHRCQCADGH